MWVSENKRHFYFSVSSWLGKAELKTVNKTTAVFLDCSLSWIICLNFLINHKLYFAAF